MTARRVGCRAAALVSSFASALAVAAPPPADAGPAATAAPETPIGAAPSASTPERWIVPDVEAQGVAPQLAATLTQVLLNRLAQARRCEILARRDLEHLLSQEQLQQLLGCKEDALCLTNIAGAVAAQAIVAGVVGRVGERHFVALTLLEIEQAKVRRRVLREARDPSRLVEAVNEAVDALLAEGEASSQGCVDCDSGPDRSSWQLVLKLGNNFQTLFADRLDVSPLGLSADLEVGPRLSPALGAFVGLGWRVTEIDTVDGAVGFQLMPLFVGGRYQSGRFAERFGLFVGAAVGAGFSRANSEAQDVWRAAFAARLQGGATVALSPSWGLLAEVSYELTTKTPRVFNERALNALALRVGLSYGL